MLNFNTVHNLDFSLSKYFHVEIKTDFFFTTKCFMNVFLFVIKIFLLEVLKKRGILHEI